MKIRNFLERNLTDYRKKEKTFQKLSKNFLTPHWFFLVTLFQKSVIYKTLQIYKN